MSSSDFRPRRSTAHAMPWISTSPMFRWRAIFQMALGLQRETHMARGIWTGALSFGLVNIPVEVHTAVRDTRPHFRLLHAKDRSPINYERVCQKEGSAVGWNDLVKGFEYEKGRFVVLTKEHFAAAAVEKTRRIDILDFVESEAWCLMDGLGHRSPIHCPRFRDDNEIVWRWDSGEG